MDDPPGDLRQVADPAASWIVTDMMADPDARAVTFGLGTACLAIAACLLIPTYYVNPHAGSAFVLIAFTIVVLGGMGSVAGALIGGLIIGVVESLSGLYLGESLGQIGIFVIFILVLLFRPSGLFGERA